MSIWLIATAIAVVAGVIWLWFDDRASDSGQVTLVPAADANRVADWAELEPATPPEPMEVDPPGHGAIRVATVGFPDGTSVTVPLRNLPIPGVRIAGGLTRLADFYQQLAPRARAGDVAAAFELARKLRQCREILSSEAPVESAPGQSQAGGERLEFCRGAEDHMLDEADMWRQMAIDAGYYWAMQDLARELRGTPDELEIWEALWQRGHASALQVLKIRYSQGISGSPPDYVRAYAYKLIEFGLMEASFRDLPSTTPTQRHMLFTVEESLRQAGSYLTAGETEIAVALAVELLRKNRNCCIGNWH